MSNRFCVRVIVFVFFLFAACTSTTGTTNELIQKDASQNETNVSDSTVMNEPMEVYALRQHITRSTDKKVIRTEKGIDDMVNEINSNLKFVDSTYAIFTNKTVFNDGSYCKLMNLMELNTTKLSTSMMCQCWCKCQ